LFAYFCPDVGAAAGTPSSRRVARCAPACGRGHPLDHESTIPTTGPSRTSVAFVSFPCLAELAVAGLPDGGLEINTLRSTERPAGEGATQARATHGVRSKGHPAEIPTRASCACAPALLLECGSPGSRGSWPTPALRRALRRGPAAELRWRNPRGEEGPQRNLSDTAPRASCTPPAQFSTKGRAEDLGEFFLQLSHETAPATWANPPRAGPNTFITPTASKHSQAIGYPCQLCASRSDLPSERLTLAVPMDPAARCAL